MNLGSNFWALFGALSLSTSMAWLADSSSVSAISLLSYWSSKRSAMISSRGVSAARPVDAYATSAIATGTRIALIDIGTSIASLLVRFRSRQAGACVSGHFAPKPMQFPGWADGKASPNCSANRGRAVRAEAKTASRGVCATRPARITRGPNPRATARPAAPPVAATAPSPASACGAPV